LSLCVALFVKDNYIMMGGDSRGCTVGKDGNYYKVNDSCEKISVVNDKIIFGSGYSAALEYIQLRFKQSENQSITKLQQICIEANEIYKNMMSIPDHPFVLSICLATIEESKVVLYHMSNTVENFKIERHFGDNDKIKISTSGFYKDEAMILTENYINKHPQLSISELYKHVYEELADEKVGGQLTIYTMQIGKGIRKRVIPIEDKKKVLTIYDVKVHYINTDGNLATHEMIARKLQITDGDDGILIDAGTKTIDFSKFETITGNLTAKNLVLNGINVEDEIGNINMSISKNGQLEVKATNSQKLIDRDGIDARAIKEEPNKCWNSGMENFSATGKPDYWSGGISSNDASFEGTYSMKLSLGQFSQQIIEGCEGLASADWWTGYDTRISLRYKYGGIKIQVFRYSDHQPLSLVDDLNATITYDENGNEIITGVRAGTYLDYFNVEQWRDGYVSFKALTPFGTGQFYIKIQNIDTVDSYIDAVQIESNYKNKSSIYSPGPRSMSPAEFSISECQEYVTVNYSAGVEIILKNRYIDVTINGAPYTTSDDPSELNGQPIYFHGKFHKENIYGIDYFSKLTLTPINSIPSTLTNGKIHVAIIGNGIKK